MQTWKRSNKQEKERLWLQLNELAHFGGNNLTDYLFFLLTLKEINYPFMIAEQMKLVSKKVLNPLVPIYFTEELYHKMQKGEVDNVNADTLFYGMEESLNYLSENDMKLGLMKEFVQTQEKQDLLTSVQVRRWLEAEELCESVIEQTGFADKDNQNLTYYIDKFIVEESWIEIQKNLNEWTKLHTLAKNTERRDILYE